MGLRVLVVEDDALQAMGLKESLTRLGHQVVGIAPSGTEAMRICSALAPQLVLMDIDLPGMDGLSVAQRLNQRQPLPVVLVTGHSGGRFIAQAKEAGVLSYLVKPVEPMALGTTLEIAFANHQRMQQLHVEVQALSHDLRARKLISRAVGIMMQNRGMLEEAAVVAIQKKAREQVLTPAEVSEEIITAHAAKLPKK